MIHDTQRRERVMGVVWFAVGVIVGIGAREVVTYIDKGRK